MDLNELRQLRLPTDHPAAKEVRQIFLQLLRSESDYPRLSRRDRFTWDIHCFETQVMNGGIDQFLWNSSGAHAIETMEALKAIGAKQSHSWLKSACDLFPDGKPDKEQEIRQEQLRQICPSEKYLDDLVPGNIEYDLFERLLNYYHTCSAD